MKVKDIFDMLTNTNMTVTAVKQQRQNLESHQRKSLQTEQNVGWPKKVAANS